MALRALFIGDGDSEMTSFHRFAAMRRIGVNAELIDPYEAMGNTFRGWARSLLHYRTGYRLLQRRMERWLDDELSARRAPDVVWVDGGELLGRRCIEKLRVFRVPVILYNLDDPTSDRDGSRFGSLLRALPSYDICISVRDETIRGFSEHGARRALQVWRSYDELAHAPFADPAHISERFRSEVAFIGTWMRGEGRDSFLMELADRGINISIWGNRWERSPLWDRLKAHWKGPNLGGRDYVAAIQGAKICVGLLSKGNRDLHTTRSLEIPYAGGLLCAERTKEHEELYREGIDAVFWSDAQECAQICHELLDNPERRRAIAVSGAERVRTLQAGNESILHYVLTECGILAKR
jgi:spore maturation protein CgeB